MAVIRPHTLPEDDPRRIGQEEASKHLQPICDAIWRRHGYNALVSGLLSAIASAMLHRRDMEGPVSLRQAADILESAIKAADSPPAGAA